MKPLVSIYLGKLLILAVLVIVLLTLVSFNSDTSEENGQSYVDTRSASISSTVDEANPDNTSTSLPTYVSSEIFTRCINTSDWKTYNNDEWLGEDGCLELSDWGMTAGNTNLSITVDKALRNSRSIYMAIPNSVHISFILDVEKLTQSEYGGNSQFYFGLGNSNDGLVKQGLIFVFQSFDKNQSVPVFAVKTFSQIFASPIMTYDIARKREIEITVENFILTLFVDGKQIYTAPVSSSNAKYFWIGYKSCAGCEIIAEIDKFQMTNE